MYWKASSAEARRSGDCTSALALGLVCAALGAIAAGIFAPMLAGKVPAFRDAFHFYYPLEVWLDAQWQSGDRLPQFNPLDGVGVNLVGESSTALFYPGRWLLAGLDWSVPARLLAFYALHIALAAGGMAYAVRRAGLDPVAAALSATAYSLSVPVFFQHVNPVYLVGAAWTPWALAESWAVVHAQRALGSAELNALSGRPVAGPRTWVWVSACSLMLLGGDPQATLNAGIIGALAIGVRTLAVWRWSDAMASTWWLLRATLLVICLTAVQWLPSWYWLQLSHRTVAEASAAQTHAIAADELPKLLEPLSRTAPQSGVARTVTSRYAYSVAPWHLLTLLWAPAAGHYMPVHSRWLQAWQAEPRMWVCSLSIGLIPILLLLSSWSHSSKQRSAAVSSLAVIDSVAMGSSRQWFLAAVVLLSAAAMLGNYAPVWALRQLCHALGAEDWARRLPGDEVGGAAWLFVHLVPGYSAFRYPAKWSVWFACALALLAGHALGRLGGPMAEQTAAARQTDSCWAALRKACTWVAFISALGLLLLVTVVKTPLGQRAMVALTSWLENSPADPWLGRPVPEAVVGTWFLSLILSLLTAGVAATALRWTGAQRWWRAMLVGLTLFELVIVNAAWTATVRPTFAALPGEHGEAISSRAVRAPEARPAAPARLWANIGRADFLRDRAGHAEPEANYSRRAQRSPAQRHVDQLCQYQADFQLGKLHLLAPQRANLSAMLSLTPRSLATVRRRLAHADDLRSDNPRLDEALAWLGVEQRLVRDGGLRWQAIPAVRPWVEWLAETDASGRREPVKGQSADSAAAAIEPVESIDVRRTASVELERQAADALALNVSASEPGRLVVRLLQDGGWTAKLTQLDHLQPEVDRQPAVNERKATLAVVPTVSHLGLFQTLPVPTGRWQIELTYCAPGLWAGGCISVGSLVIVCLTWVRAWMRGRSQQS